MTRIVLVGIAALLLLVAATGPALAQGPAIAEPALPGPSAGVPAACLDPSKCVREEFPLLLGAVIIIIIVIKCVHYDKEGHKQYWDCNSSMVAHSGGSVNTMGVPVCASLATSCSGIPYVQTSPASAPLCATQCGVTTAQAGAGVQQDAQGDAVVSWDATAEPGSPVAPFGSPVEGPDACAYATQLCDQPPVTVAL